MNKIKIVGVGALGSTAAMLIRNEAELTIWDFDRVSPANLQSQLHGKASLNKLKTDSLKATMQFMWGVKIEGIGNKLTADNVSLLGKQSSLIIDATDNGQTRRLIQGYCIKNQLPLLHGALAPNGEFGRVAWSPAFKVDDESAAGAPTCENGEFLPFITIVASYLARAAQIFLKTGKRVGWEVTPGNSIQTL